MRRRVVFGADHGSCRRADAQRPFYAVRVSLQPETVAPGDRKLLAGMSADVFIQTGERTVLAYLAAPLLRTFHRGMRES